MSRGWSKRYGRCGRYGRRRGIGIRRLSKGAPVAPRTIYGIERGESTPQVETIRKISRFLKVAPMRVAEFRAALEAEGLTELPPEREELGLGAVMGSSLGSFAASPGSPSVGGYESPGWDRGRQIEELLRLMRDLEREDVDAVYRLIFRDEPPRS